MKAKSRPEKLLVISFVSGKGGVGKTMLTVACARELSLNNRTLLIDLDFFNRGLTGLLGAGTKSCGVIDKPKFLSTVQPAESGQWEVVQVGPNLFHISYPDLSTEDMQRFETLQVDVLQASLREFVAMAAEKCDCDCVVIDCHGGPDNSSFAACLMSDHSILVSEPDRITFYGTLNFLRQLKQASPSQDIDLHLVFNKVVPAFSGLFLNNFYNRLVRDEFDGRPLLGIFPLEVYLTKEFEKTPFLTLVYPFSWLARKSRLLLFDLLRKKPEYLAPAIRTMPRFVRAYRKIALGRPFPLLNLNVIMPTIVTGVVALALFMAAFESFFFAKQQHLADSLDRIHVFQCINSYPQADPETIKNSIEHPSFFYITPESKITDADTRHFVTCTREHRTYYRERAVLRERTELLQQPEVDRQKVPEAYRDAFDRELQSIRQQSNVFLLMEQVNEVIVPYLTLLGYLAALWLILALLTTWTIELDKRFTYYFRLHRHTLVAFYAAIPIALWFGPLLVVAVFCEALMTGPREWLAGQGLLLIALPALSFAAILANQIYRLYRDARYEGHYLEDLLRLMFLGYLVIGPWAIYRVFIR